MLGPERGQQSHYFEEKEKELKGKLRLDILELITCIKSIENAQKIDFCAEDLHCRRVNACTKI